MHTCSLSTCDLHCSTFVPHEELDSPDVFFDTELVEILEQQFGADLSSWEQLNHWEMTEIEVCRLGLASAKKLRNKRD